MVAIDEGEESIEFFTGDCHPVLAEEVTQLPLLQRIRTIPIELAEEVDHGLDVVL